MKKWVKKLLDQFDLDIKMDSDHSSHPKLMSEEKATVLYMIDVLNKHLIELEKHSVRKTRETLDEYTKEIIQADEENIERVLFRFRQFYSHYRIDEYNYFERTFEDFKTIVWDFVDQLSDDLNFDTNNDRVINEKLHQLKDAVEANSIDELKNQSRDFIDTYVEFQSKKANRNTKKMAYIEKNLTTVKKKLTEANKSMRHDHLTKAFNRKSFDEHIKTLWSDFQSDHKPVSLMILDIDFFKKINDNFGHDIGDFVLVECVKLLKDIFSHENHFVARIGGEEFAVVLKGYRIEHAADKAHKALERIRKEAFVKDDQKLNFTVSMGVAQLGEGETLSNWVKRADEALYESKNGGRDQFTLSKFIKSPIRVA